MQNRNPAYMTTPGERDVQIMASCNAGASRGRKHSSGCPGNTDRDSSEKLR